MAGKKRKRKNAAQRPGIHPRNKYCDNPPDFGLLASLYPAFQPHVFYSPDGRPRIDWTDFNATRQLTRVLLLHDHALNWWIPDGQLCPTVPNRSNYIHWIQDLLDSEIIPATSRDDADVKGFDIGTGANCIYPLLGASLHGWKFVGSDITDVAIEWANQNVNSNPHISNLIEIRKVGAGNKIDSMEDLRDSSIHSSGDSLFASSYTNTEDNGSLQSSVLTASSSLKKCYDGLPVLVDVVKDGEVFDFCMCNPPFFESMEEAGLNPKTSCGGTPEEMVCSGGEHAFITRIIEDSTKLKHTFRWYTSMVGRKVNLNILVSQLWNVGATVVKTTEFVQGRTSRWGLAWSFVTPLRKMIGPQKIVENNLSFMLEGLQRRHAAFHVLQFVESYLVNGGASCKLDTAAFHVDVTISKDQISAILNNQTHMKSRATDSHHELNTSNTISDENGQPHDVLRFRILVFEQIPGTFLVRGTLLDRASTISGLFPSVFHHLEEVVMSRFCSGRAFVDAPSSSLRT